MSFDANEAPRGVETLITTNILQKAQQQAESKNNFPMSKNRIYICG